MEICHEVDQPMFVSIANIMLNVLGAKKLLSWWIGPFWITKRIRVVACYVQLLGKFKIHNVLHVSFLRSNTTDGML